MGKVVNIFTGEVIDLERPQPQPVKEPEPIELTPAELAAYIEYCAEREQPTQNADGVHVGDIFHCSWGYDMVCNTFYQVVELRGKHTAVVVELSKADVEGDGWRGYERAVRDCFPADGKRFTVRTKADADGKTYFAEPQLHGSYHTCSPTNELTRHWYNHCD
jgi:hypothetical protein